MLFSCLGFQTLKQDVFKSPKRETRAPGNKQNARTRHGRTDRRKRTKQMRGVCRSHDLFCSSSFVPSSSSSSSSRKATMKKTMRTRSRSDDDDDDGRKEEEEEEEVETFSFNDTNGRRRRRRRREVLAFSFAVLSFSSASSSSSSSSYAFPDVDFTKQSQSTFLLGPLKVTSLRLRALREDIARGDVKLGSEEATARLRNATLDCTSARPALEAYANVRDVCTLSIVSKSVSKKYANDEAKRRAAERKEATVQAYAALEAVLKDANASEEQINAAFDSVGACVRKFAESVLEAFAFEEEAEAAKREEFPELFR